MKRFGPCQPAQADMGGYFSQMNEVPFSYNMAYLFPFTGNEEIDFDEFIAMMASKQQQESHVELKEAFKVILQLFFFFLIQF